MVGRTFSQSRLWLRQVCSSAHLHVCTQDEKIKTISEFVAAPLPAYEFAREVCERLVAPLTQGQRRKIVVVYLAPSNFKHIDDGHSIADQINEVLEPYRLGCLEASNDRIGGWQLMYQMLQTGKWQIADTRNGSNPNSARLAPEHSNIGRSRWLASFHSRHRHTRNLRARREVALMLMGVIFHCLQEDNPWAMLQSLPRPFQAFN